MNIKKVLLQRIYILPVFLFLLAIAGYEFDKRINSCNTTGERFTVEKTFSWKADSINGIKVFNASEKN